MRPIPDERLTPVNEAPIRAGGEYVLYWMIANRRTRWSFALEHALFRAEELGRPLVVLEPLRVGYRWASRRHHRFLIDGMVDNAGRFATAGVTCWSYIEPEQGAGAGLLEALARRAAVVVTDEFPSFFLPRMVSAAGDRLPVRLEMVDGSGLLPLRAVDRDFSTAASFRRVLHRRLPELLERFPLADPLSEAGDLTPVELPSAVLERWPSASADALERLPIDSTVGPVPLRGGSVAAEVRWRAFLADGLERYHREGRHPDAEATTGLSPYLHFGYISPHQLVAELIEREGLAPGAFPAAAIGSREGYWGLSPSAEALLDQLVTWRELGVQLTFRHPTSYQRYEVLPEWARRTLEEHADDPRPTIYSFEQLEAANTHDPVWNAAQRQLLREGRVHNYLRMLWGKLIFQWSPSPRRALERMFELNDRYALDGRDPNSASGILWCLGKFDRAWGPERPIFGKVRYMTSASAMKKLRLRRYLDQYGPE